VKAGLPPFKRKLQRVRVRPEPERCAMGKEQNGVVNGREG
jgi:hypothetical protein